jgi:hypothetical protein
MGLQLAVSGPIIIVVNGLVVPSLNCGSTRACQNRKSSEISIGGYMQTHASVSCRCRREIRFNRRIGFIDYIVITKGLSFIGYIVSIISVTSFVGYVVINYISFWLVMVEIKGEIQE